MNSYGDIEKDQGQVSPEIDEKDEMNSQPLTPEHDSTSSNLQRNEIHSSVTAVFIDGPAVVQMIPPKKGATFDCYAEKQFIPYIKKFQKNEVTRIDTIFDVHDENKDNLKQQTHDKRGEKQGPEIEITGNIKAPSGRVAWKMFLRVKANKTALYCFLADKLAAIESVVIFYATAKDYVVVNNDPFTGELNGSLHTLAPCSHPEADTTIFCHIMDAVQHGHQNVLIRTVDSDIPIIGTGLYNELAPLKHLFVEYGKSKTLQLIPIHEVVLSLGPKARVMPLFHALSGCDTTSSCIWCGKRLI